VLLSLAFIFSRAAKMTPMSQKYAICIKNKQSEGFASKWQSP
jgi:hypothetical protein